MTATFSKNVPAAQAHYLIVFSAVVIALVISLANWIRIASLDDFHLGSLLHDDGYYYLRVAENLLDGQGSTFDGTNPTTGFQPLYQGVTVLIVLAARLAGLSVFKLVFFVNLAIVGLAAWLIATAVNQISHNSQPRLVYAFAMLLLPLNLPLVFKRLSAGMEAALSLLLLSVLLKAICALSTAPPEKPWRVWGPGLLCSALTLTRIDYAVFGVVFLMLLWFTRRRLGLRSVVYFGVGYSLPLSLYALLAFFYLDSVLPISLLAKQHYISQHNNVLSLTERMFEFIQNGIRIWFYPLGYSVFGYYWQWGVLGLGLGAAGVLLCGALLILANRNAWRDGPQTLRWALTGFGLATAAHAVSFAWSGANYITPAYFWYYTPELSMIVLALTCAYGIGLRRITHSTNLITMALALTLVGSSGLYDLQQDVQSYGPYRETIEITKRLTPATAVIGSWDAGFNNYWLRPRTIINLDGMANSRDFLEQVIRSGDYDSFFAQHHVQYILNMVPDTPENRHLVWTEYFRHPSIMRACYDILAEMTFERQGLVIYLLQYHCLPLGGRTANRGYLR